MLSKEEFLTHVRDEVKFFLEGKKIIPMADLIAQGALIISFVVVLFFAEIVLSQLYNFSWIFPCLGGVLLLWFMKKAFVQLRCIYRLKRALVELSLSACEFQRVQGVFKKDFLEKSKIMPEKYHFDFEFKGLGGTKEFYGASVSIGKKGDEKHNLLLAIPYTSVNNHILIYNQNWMLKFFVSGYEKVEPLFSHKMFDENIIFAKNAESTSLVLNEAFAERLDQIKQSLSTKTEVDVDLEQKNSILPRIDLAFYEGQLLIYVYDYALYFDPFDTREKPTTTAQDFANLYERFKKLHETIQILTH